MVYGGYKRNKKIQFPTERKIQEPSFIKFKFAFAFH